MATMLGVLASDAQISNDVWREMVWTSVSRSFNQITVDGDTNTNDCVIAMASGLSGILTHDSTEAQRFQACLDAVMQGLAKSIAWEGDDKQGEETFPHLLSIFSKLVQIFNPPIEVADLVKLIYKIFWSSIYLEIPGL